MYYYFSHFNPSRSLPLGGRTKTLGEMCFDGRRRVRPLGPSVCVLNKALSILSMWLLLSSSESVVLFLCFVVWMVMHRTTHRVEVGGRHQPQISPPWPGRRISHSGALWAETVIMHIMFRDMHGQENNDKSWPKTPMNTVKKMGITH